MSEEAYWTIRVLWGAKIYADAPEGIRERLSAHYPTYNGAHESATVVTQWARIPLRRAKISCYDPFVETLIASRLRPRRP